MRITEDRYSQHRRSLDLAWRLIKLEARTRTISRWTQLSGHRIRALYKSYSSKQHTVVTRHRGMSPYKLEAILSSPKLRCEGAMLTAICRFLHVLPPGTLSDPDRALPSIERGELLCEAYDWFRFDVPDMRLTFEHSLLLINELARGELLQFGACRTCRGIILLDRLSTGRRECVFCSTRVESNEPMAVLDKLPELLGDRGKECVDRRALREHLRDQRVRVAPTHATPHQLSLLSECSDLNVTTVENQREHVTTAMFEDSECSISSSQRNHPGQESPTRAMASIGPAPT
jgi:hypothetical protein